MNLLTDETEITLIDSIYDLPHKHNGTGYTMDTISDWEDIPRKDPFVIVTFSPTSLKIGQSLDNYIEPNENTNYNTYGYGEYDYCSIKAYARQADGTHGKALTKSWITEIESYIKNSWDSLITGGSVDVYSFSHNKLVNPLVKRQHGYEVNFRIATTNTWTDEPESGAISPIDISGIYITTGFRISVEV